MWTLPKSDRQGPLESLLSSSGRSGTWTPLPTDCQDPPPPSLDCQEPSGLWSPPPSSRLSGPSTCGHFLHPTTGIIWGVDISLSRLSGSSAVWTALLLDGLCSAPSPGGYDPLYSTVPQSRSLSSSSVLSLQCRHPQVCVP